MIVRCEYLHSIKSTASGKDLYIELEDVNYYDFWMNNDMAKILDEIPTEELEAYLKKRIENDK